MMEMHTAKLPDGMYAYIIGEPGKWEIWTDDMLHDDTLEVIGMGYKQFEGIQSLASAELILEQTFGAKA